MNEIEIKVKIDDISDIVKKLKKEIAIFRMKSTKLIRFS